MMTIRQFLPYTVAFAMAFLPGLVRADVVLDSGAGLSACMFNSNASSCGPSGDTISTTGSSIAFGGQGVATTSVTTVDSSWQGIPVVNPGDSSDQSAVWIGAVDSGYCSTACGKFVPSNTTSANSLPGATNPTNGGAPVYQITSQSFTAGTGSTLDLNVWADDSVDVFLVNQTTSTSSEISPPGTSAQPGGACSGQQVSCTPPTEGSYSGIALLNGDTYSLQFDVWQTGSGTDNSSNPTGLLYTGDALGASVAAPEPGAVTLLLTMLMAVAGLAGVLKKKLA
jgi:hypothetical protein